MNKELLVKLNLGSLEFSADDQGALDCYEIGRKLRLVASNVESYGEIDSGQTLYGIIADNNAATIGEYEIAIVTLPKMYRS
jgi:hypothetical protein